MKTQLVLSSLLALACTAAQASEKPNILVIFADDVGWGDAGCYGATKIKTPNIDRLAREGQRFVNGHASAAVCTPTRYSLLTGRYSWRRNAVGLNKGVANGDSPLLIPTSMTTAPGMLKQAGYQNALIGKWHLGFGESQPDYNKDLRPGPLEVGFHQFFGIPATNDRVPTVFVRDHRVVNLDPKDPLHISYDKADAQQQGMTPFAAGRNRIGWAKGGKTAWWKDTEISDTLTHECVRFIENNKDNNFFLLYAPHNVHAPTITHPRFAGSSGLGNRADMLMELDASIGRLLETLDRLELARNTLVIFSSDNGAYVTDEDGHKPNGPFRGKKSQLWEGGHRVPFIVRWPTRIQPGEPDHLVSTIDIPATIAAAAGASIPENSLPDSRNLLPALLGEKDAKTRDILILMSGTGHLAVRSGNYKFIPDLDHADGWQTSNRKKPNAPAKPGLYDLSADPGETKNLYRTHNDIAQRLAVRLEAIRRN